MDKLKIEVEGNKEAKDKIARLEKEVQSEKRQLYDVIGMTMKIQDIGGIQVDSKDITLIGAGNFGQVYRATHNGKDFSIKINKKIDLSMSMELMDTDLDKFLDSKAKDRSVEWRKLLKQK